MVSPAIEDRGAMQICMTSVFSNVATTTDDGVAGALNMRDFTSGVSGMLTMRDFSFGLPGIHTTFESTGALDMPDLTGILGTPIFASTFANPAFSDSANAENFHMAIVHDKSGSLLNFDILGALDMPSSPFELSEMPSVLDIDVDYEFDFDEFLDFNTPGAAETPRIDDEPSTKAAESSDIPEVFPNSTTERPNDESAPGIAVTSQADNVAEQDTTSKNHPSLAITLRNTHGDESPIVSTIPAFPKLNSRKYSRPRTRKRNIPKENTIGTPIRFVS
jgi:hypothetical protein